MPGSARGAHGGCAAPAAGDLPAWVSPSLDGQVVCDSSGPPTSVVPGEPARGPGGPANGRAQHLGSVAPAGESGGESLFSRGVGSDGGGTGPRRARLDCTRHCPGGINGPYRPLTG